MTSGGERLTLIFIHDVSDRVRAEAALRTQATLEAASLAKARMIGYIAHEIGNPLHGIVGLTRLMLAAQPEALSAGQLKRLQMIDSCARQATALMHDVLDLHRVEAGDFNIVLQPVALSAAFDSALAAIAGQAELAGIPLRRMSLPAGLSVQADPVRLQQVLVNLLSNAVKYNQPGGDVILTAAGATLNTNCKRFDFWRA